MQTKRSDFYQRYMLSEEWNQKRKQRIWVDEGRCTMCGKSSDEVPLQVHHLSYRRLGDENILTDLATVCPECHRKLHRFYNRVR